MSGNDLVLVTHSGSAVRTAGSTQMRQVRLLPAVAGEVAAAVRGDPYRRAECDGCRPPGVHLQGLERETNFNTIKNHF